MNNKWKPFVQDLIHVQVLSSGDAVANVSGIISDLEGINLVDDLSFFLHQTKQNKHTMPPSQDSLLSSQGRSESTTVKSDGGGAGNSNSGSDGVSE